MGTCAGLLVAIWQGPGLYALVQPWLSPPTAEQIALTDRVYSDLRSPLYQWRITYMTMYPEGFDYFQNLPEARKANGTWQMLRDEPTPSYSEQSWARYRPLFLELAVIRTRLQETLAANPGVVDAETNAAVLHLRSQLDLMQRTYDLIPRRPEWREETFKASFTQTLAELEKLATLIERKRPSGE